MLTGSDLRHMLNEGNWFNSREINYYMQVVRMCQNDVHVIDCDWFADGLSSSASSYGIGCAALKIESEKCRWFDQHYIVIPVNVDQIHWILIIIDVQKSHILYFDSLKHHISERILYRLHQYLVYEYFLSHGVALNWELFETRNYSAENTFFPRQSDGGSCGAHVCAIARAVCSGCIIGTKLDLDNCLRQYIVRDIITNSICTDVPANASDNEESFTLPNIETLEQSLRFEVPCTECKVKHRFDIDKYEFYSANSFTCVKCARVANIEKINSETLIEIQRYRHDPREEEVFELYNFINMNVCHGKLSPDPQKCLVVFLDENIKQMGTALINNEHPMKYTYIRISGFHCSTYIDLYETLVHEIAHVITARNDGVHWLHQKPFQRNVSDLIKKLNGFSAELPHPFKGLHVRAQCALARCPDC